MLAEPVLSYLDFNKQFTIETDTCFTWIGEVLMQEGNLVSYYSSTLTIREGENPPMLEIYMPSIK